MVTLIEARDLSAGYGSHPIVRNLDLTVSEGEVVALLGANGAGKTTTLMTLSGALPSLGGSILVNGRVTGAQLHRRAKDGLALVTEDRSVFMRLTVAENLRVGRCDQQLAFMFFPELVPLQKRRCGLLSGGEQQMLTLGRALARRPKLLLVDELSLGLGPMVVRRLLQVVRKAADEEGLGVLLVEQHVQNALEVADTAYLMRNGRIAMHGPTTELRDKVEEIEAMYLSGDMTR